MQLISFCESQLVLITGGKAYMHVKSDQVTIYTNQSNSYELKPGLHLLKKLLEICVCFVV